MLARLPDGPPLQTPNHWPHTVEGNSARSNQRYSGSQAAAVAVARHRASPQLPQPACREKVSSSREAEATAPAPDPRKATRPAPSRAGRVWPGGAIVTPRDRPAPPARIQGRTGVLGHAGRPAPAGDRDPPSAAVPRSTQPTSGWSNRSARATASICTSASGETSAATLGSPPGVPGGCTPGLTSPCCSRLVSRPRRRRSTRPSRVPKARAQRACL